MKILYVYEKTGACLKPLCYEMRPIHVRTVRWSCIEETRIWGLGSA